MLLWTVLYSAILWVLTAQPHEGQSRVPARQITALNQSDYPPRADTPAHIWAACSDSLTRLVWRQPSQSFQLHRKSIVSGDVGGSSARDCRLKGRSAHCKWTKMCRISGRTFHLCTIWGWGLIGFIMTDGRLGIWGTCRNEVSAHLMWSQCNCLKEFISTVKLHSTPSWPYFSHALMTLKHKATCTTPRSPSLSRSQARITGP